MSNSKSFVSISVALCTSLIMVACGGGESSSPIATGNNNNFPPIVTFVAQPALIKQGASSSIHWSATNSTSCTSASWSDQNVFGTFNTPILNATTTYSITCTGPGGETTKSITVTVVTGAACSTAGATNIISLSNVISRLGGVAPLAVFFDATGTTASTAARPFHELEYTWSFGDSGGGATWVYGSRTGALKSAAKGPVAAHVFESSGNYGVTLNVTDGQNSASITCPIVVDDPELVFSGLNTVCIAGWNSSAMTTQSPKPVAGTGGCPMNARTVVEPSFSAAIGAYAKSGTRVLFQRGDTFTAASAASITETGPGTVGSFGPASLPPSIQGAGGDILSLSSATTPGISDWRVMDLEISGTPTSFGVAANGGINQVTLLRLTIHDVNRGVSFSGSNLDYYNSHGQGGHALWDQLAIVDSSITHMTGSIGYGIFASAGHFSLLGNFLDDVTAGTHVVRTPQVVKGVLSNNTFSRQGSTYHLLKMHACSWCNNTLTPGCNYLTDAPPAGVGGINGGYTEQVVISDNKFIPGTIAPWSVDLGPQNGYNDERLRNIIVERNRFTAAASTQVSLVVNAVDVTVRNNICDMTGGASGRYCFNPMPRATVSYEPPPDNIRIFNNTAYSADASAQFGVVLVDPQDTNIIVKNNLAFAPQAGNAKMIYGTAKSIAASNNSSDSQILNTSPNFASASPTTPANFNITGGSYAIGTNNACSGIPCGTDAGVPVWSDFFLITQPVARDLGAIIHF